MHHRAAMRLHTRTSLALPASIHDRARRFSIVDRRVRLSIGHASPLITE